MMFFFDSMRVTKVSLWVMVVSLSACSSLPSLPEISAENSPEHWQTAHPDGVSLTANAQTAALDDLSRWWQRWQDPTLNQLLDLTLANNVSLSSAGINYQIALLQAGVASAKYRPKANVGVGANQAETTDQSTTSFNASLNASWEFDLWGSAKAQRNKAEATVQRSLEDLHAAQVSLVAQVVQTYLNLRNAQAQQQLVAEAIKLREQDYLLAGYQYQAGLTTELQEVQALAVLRQTEAQLQPHKKAELAALQQLRALVGGDLGALQTPLENVQELPSVNAEVLALPADVLRQRPDVKAKEQSIYEQSAALVVAKNARYPSFALSGSISNSNQHFSDVFDVDAMVSRLAANLSLILFDGGVLRRAIAVQKLQLEQSLLQYRNALLTAQQEVTVALTNLSSAQMQQASYDQASAAADLGADLAAKQYDAGLLDMSKLIGFRTVQLNSRGSLLNNRTDILTSWVQLYRSMGGGWQSLDSTPLAATTTGESGE